MQAELKISQNYFTQKCFAAKNHKRYVEILMYVQWASLARRFDLSMVELILNHSDL